ncbi:hypothetical protein HK101_002237 [Irineochytrium annulatum]|nr:hypothetical protein HK101_002237 [Irineochytrium annulatum]
MGGLGNLRPPSFDQAAIVRSAIAMSVKKEPAGEAAEAPAAADVDSIASDNEDEDDHEDTSFEYAPLGDCDVAGDDDDQGDERNAAPKRPDTVKTVIEVGEAAQISEADLETIRSVMAGISLPPSSTPEWAKIIDESEWLPEIVYTGQEKVAK